MFHGVIHKITLAQFFLRHGVVAAWHYSRPMSQTRNEQHWRCRLLSILIQNELALALAHVSVVTHVNGKNCLSSPSKRSATSLICHCTCAVRYFYTDTRHARFVYSRLLL